MVTAFAQLGQHGWELIGVYDKSSNWLTQFEKGFALFKRAVPEGQEPDGPWAAAQHADDFLPEGEAPSDPNWGAW